MYHAPARQRFQHFSPDTPKGMRQPKLLDRVRAVARVRHLSLRTEQAYSDWIRRFILFHRKRHPEQVGAEKIRLFLSHLAVEGRVSASTQNVALCALLFLHRDVLQIRLAKEFPGVGDKELAAEFGHVVRKIEKKPLGVLPDGREAAYTRLDAELEKVRRRAEHSSTTDSHE